jgi:hypothetical protein
VVISANLEELHSPSNNINKQTALTEKSELVSGRGETVNMHDILTGSDPQGMYSTRVATRLAGTGRRAVMVRQSSAIMIASGSRIPGT